MAMLCIGMISADYMRGYYNPQLKGIKTVSKAYRNPFLLYMLQGCFPSRIVSVCRCILLLGMCFCANRLRKTPTTASEKNHLRPKPRSLPAVELLCFNCMLCDVSRVSRAVLRILCCVLCVVLLL